MKFFHLKASARKVKNNVSCLEDGNGNWIENMEVVEKMFCEYFTNIFTSTKPSHEQMNSPLSDLPAKITREMADYLEQPFSEKEITDALA